MSKQTINIGASPNDGTGTPLRTSFDYTNQNFTEIYTALGGGVALPGATTQVIFNDGGTNLAGDAGLVYNKTTDALTVAGLVTAGSATITGDLTVDTSTLKVDSTLDKVGVGVAALTGLSKFNVAGDIALTSDLVLKNSGGTVQGYIFGSSGINYRVVASNPHVWQEGGTDLMRLNSTGLGVGTPPNQKFVCAGPRAYFAGGGAVYGIGVGFNTTRTAADQVFFIGATDSATPDLVISNAAGSSVFRIDTSGNVGVGVTPSAWQSSWKAIDIGLTGGVSNGFGQTDIASNVYRINSGAAKYKAAATAATSYTQVSGTHTFFTAGVSVNAGDTIAFSPSFTINASGLPIFLATTTTPASLTTNGELTMTATSNTNLRFSYRGSDGTTRVANLTLA